MRSTTPRSSRRASPRTDARNRGALARRGERRGRGARVGDPERRELRTRAPCTPTCGCASTVRGRRPSRSWTCATTTASSPRNSPRRLSATVDAGDKAILFLNRRGFASFLVCDHCGFTWMCPHCDVTLTLFGGRGLRCRTCGHAEAAPAACPSCGSADLVRHGLSHERVEREVRGLPAGRRTSCASISDVAFFLRAAARPFSTASPRPARACSSARR